MNYPLPAPCIVHDGTLINHDDIRRLLGTLHHVHYIHKIDGVILDEGEGWIMEIFSDPQQSTLVSNGILHLNLQSFDYLELHQDQEQRACYTLVQDHRRLEIRPLKTHNKMEQFEAVDNYALEVMLTEVLSAKLDMQIDDDMF
jgi:hypothetical protein